jgi:hypothetical protein
VLENYLGDNINMFENESSENIINMVENTLKNYPEFDLQNIMNTSEINNVPDPNNKDNTVGVGRSLIISASILGSSLVISNVIPTILEILLK